MTEDEKVERINALIKRIGRLERAIDTVLIITHVFLTKQVSPTISTIDEILIKALEEK